jgi:formate/nitrite transporter
MGYKKSNEIVKTVNQIAYEKRLANNTKTFVLALLGGAYIAFGGILAIMIGGGIPAIAAANPGLQKFIFAAVFPLGLILIAVAGGELFTGNTSYFIPSVLNKNLPISAPFKNWTIVYIGNFIGSLFIAYFIAYFTGILGESPWKEATIHLAEHKVEKGFWIVLVKGIACNWLVALAMWKSYAARDISGKILAIWIPIMAFVAMGFEHSIANMFFIPTAIFYGADIAWTDFIFHNLVPATIGNTIGGAFFVGCIYWFVYDKK